MKHVYASLLLLLSLQCSIGNVSLDAPNIGQLVLIEPLQLSLCILPKVASTQLYTFLGHLLYNTKWNIGPNEVNKIRFKVPRLMNMPHSQRQNILDTYQHIVVLRDPAERLLSAYLDKIKNCTTANNASMRYAYNIGLLDYASLSSTSFDTFVDTLERGQLNPNCHYQVNSRVCFSNEHWAAQSSFCGLTELPAQTYYLGDVKLYEIMQRIFDSVRHRVSMSEHYNSSFIEFINLLRIREHTSDGRLHATNSHAQMLQYYTPALYSRVMKLFHDDYRIFRFSSKLFEALF